MQTSDEEPVPVHLGDYPDGAYWSAERRADTDEAEAAAREVSGSVIRLMWDYGVRIPLWDAEGLLPEDRPWLRDTLGLSDPLIDDLGQWGRDMEALDAFPSRRTVEAFDRLGARARELAERLRQELDTRYGVEYHPW